VHYTYTESAIQPPGPLSGAELPLHSCHVSVTIQKRTEVPHAAKCGRHFHLSFHYKMYQRVPPTFCAIRHSKSTSDCTDDDLHRVVEPFYSTPVQVYVRSAKAGSSLPPEPRKTKKKDSSLFMTKRNTPQILTNNYVHMVMQFGAFLHTMPPPSISILCSSHVRMDGSL
jgi:hypothetical protein